MAPGTRIHNVHEHSHDHKYHGNGEATTIVSAGRLSWQLRYPSADYNYQWVQISYFKPSDTYHRCTLCLCTHSGSDVSVLRVKERRQYKTDTKYLCAVCIVATYEVNQPLHGHLMRPDALATIEFVTHGDLSIYLLVGPGAHTVNKHRK